ncbi:MAG: NUDIX domain-containing protein, partial [Steroidobacteraceae bacterium]
MVRPATPALTVDVVIAMKDRPGHPIVLIERAHPPPGYALPGGFVDIGETVEAWNSARPSARTDLAV